MQLHLFSTPGVESIEYILAASRSILENQNNPIVAYLPAASIHRRWIRETKAAFRGLTSVSAIKVGVHSAERIRSILDQATLLYIPGGNTYLFAQRLHETQLTHSGETRSLFEEIKTRVVNGLPLMAFSAGAVLCGRDILTTNDINCCGCPRFEGLDLLPFNLNVHYPSSPGPEREARDDRLQAYLVFHKHSIVALEDGAYLRVTGEETTLVHGNAWRLVRGKPTLSFQPTAFRTK